MSAMIESASHIRVFAQFGDGALLLAHVKGEERISDSFCYHLELLTDDSVRVIDATNVVGKKISFAIKSRADELRYFNGYIRRFVYCGRDDYHKHYRAEVVSWLWFLSRRTTSRMFQNKTVVEIVQEIFGQYGFAEYELRLDAEYPAREFCVQYQESDLDFVARLLEEEGIFYYFEHDQSALDSNEVGKHTLILGDHKGAYSTAAEDTVRFHSSVNAQHDDDPIWSWEQSHEFITGNFTQRDYNFKSPTDTLQQTAPSLVELDDISDFERFEYPGGFGYPDGPEPDARDQTDERWGELTRRRMEEEEVRYSQVRGTSVCVSFTPGHTFTMEYNHSTEETDKSYLLLAVKHEADARGAYASGTNAPAENGTVYRNAFTCMPGDVIFRPARRAARPKIAGAQTATVVGPEGEIVYPDEYGRVKVKFHWDRADGADESSSCWVRVSQNWAGSGWGGMHLPHVGQEVIVEFIEGDPSRPIITGRVYNRANMPPLELPEAKELSCIRDHRGNELVFDARDDTRHIFLHSPSHCSTIALGKGVHSDDVGGYNLPLNESLDEDVTGIAMQTDANFKHFVGGNASILIEGNKSETVRGDSGKVHVGSKFGGTIGFKGDVDLCGSASIFIGFKAAFEAAMKVEVSFGTSVKWALSKEYNIGGGPFTQHTSGRILLNSDSEIFIIGGSKDESVIDGNDKAITLQYGSNPAAKKVKPECAAKGGLFAGTLAGLGAMLGLSLGVLDKQKGSSQWDAAVWGGGAGAAALGATTAAATILYRKFNKSDTVADSAPSIGKVHTNVDAQIELQKQGVFIKGIKGGSYNSWVSTSNMQGGKVIVGADSAVEVKAPTITLKGDQVIATDGKLKTKNLLDAG
jgi:type VI secretion system secreted protein VgrG